jgi:endonuclease/exonuclease/phosphatase family metal-dependent hydrolase
MRRAASGVRRAASSIVLCCLLGCGDGADLTVMSFNVRYGTAQDGGNAWEHRRDLLLATVREQDPDILGVQEALRFQLDEIGAALPGHAEIGAGRDAGDTRGEYSALLIRRGRFDVDTSGTFWLSDTPETPGSMSWGNRITRICTWALLRDRVTGSGLAVFNTHLDHESQPARERGAGLIADRIALLASGVPVLVLGDFNAGEDNPALARFRADGFLDTYRVIDPDTTGDGTFSAFAGDSTGAKIDYVLARGPWVVKTADILRRRTGDRDPSDHFPVVARLRLP